MKVRVETRDIVGWFPKNKIKLSLECGDIQYRPANDTTQPGDTVECNTPHSYAWQNAAAIS